MYNLFSDFLNYFLYQMTPPPPRYHNMDLPYLASLQLFTPSPLTIPRYALDNIIKPR